MQKKKNKLIESGVNPMFWERVVVPFLLKRANYKCQICGSTKNLEAHHWRYDRQTIRDMNILCKSCHSIQHFNPELRKKLYSVCNNRGWKNE